MRSSLLTAAVLTATTAFASPVVVIAERQSSTTCGNDYYSSSQVSAATQKGYQLYESGQTLGSDSYPHEFHNYSGFEFSVSSPYYEFPILESGLYDGGSPGADRVIFNGKGQYAGAITHTGAASYDGFVGCSGTTTGSS